MSFLPPASVKHSNNACKAGNLDIIASNFKSVKWFFGVFSERFFAGGGRRVESEEWRVESGEWRMELKLVRSEE